MLRTHEAGTLRATDAGTTVTLAGWVARRRDHGGVTFLDLRDASGVVQVVVRDEAVAHELRSEYCLAGSGEVSARPQGNENPELPTGDIEVIAADVTVLNASAPLPFQIDERVTVGEEARLRHRYLDLRRPGASAAGQNLRLRSRVNAAARAVLVAALAQLGVEQDPRSLSPDDHLQSAIMLLRAHVQPPAADQGVALGPQLHHSVGSNGSHASPDDQGQVGGVGRRRDRT